MDTRPHAKPSLSVQPGDPAAIPAFDQAMRKLVKVSKADVDAGIKREAKQKKPK